MNTYFTYGTTCISLAQVLGWVVTRLGVMVERNSVCVNHRVLRPSGVISTHGHPSNLRIFTNAIKMSGWKISADDSHTSSRVGFRSPPRGHPLSAAPCLISFFLFHERHVATRPVCIVFLLYALPFVYESVCFVQYEGNTNVSRDHWRSSFRCGGGGGVISPLYTTEQAPSAQYSR